MAEPDARDEHFVEAAAPPFPVKLEKALAAGAMALLCIITMANVVVRYFTNISFAFTEEISVWLMVVMTLVGAAGAPHRASARSRRLDGDVCHPGGFRHAHGLRRLPLRGDLACPRRASVAVHRVAARALAADRSAPAPACLRLPET